MDMTPKPDETDRRFATTLARGMAVLRAFRASDDGLGNQEIAARTGLPKSTVSRLTFTLHSLGYLSHAGWGEKYRPGPALLALGNIAAASVGFVDVADPIMQPLADETGTLVVLAVRDDAKMLLMKTWRPAGVSSIWLDVGQRIPIVGSASGHAVLAALPDGDGPARDAYGQMIRDGFVTVPLADRYTPTINAVAVPYRSRAFAEPVAFTCGAMAEDLSDARAQSEVGPRLRDAVRQLEHATGTPPALVRRG
ncbi:DNA-binding IclR family transcriptional regulator [Rubricella aquisinus]|uniref:DNA-binding IclR family transcriptional regulator n=1 Tax=Rubricella aquisinus TaxID=2028108 RepID=A0A840X0H8_9RHOB|nr:IclR family transcriptional regulator [Rubricella aquisinus]MBB5514167.1 DNA-binding IclR family transcriptional regulator [Rubricella aquisinus]